jgi:hypothetical protein
MKSKTIRVIGFILYCLFWMAMVYLFVGCATNSQTSHREGFMPSGMAEDAQDYPTKYNMMDSQDGRRNPNAQVNIFGATY